MIKRLILIRHGETSSNKTDPARKLTKHGALQVQKSVSKISKLIGPKTAILSGNTNRTLQTAHILSKHFNVTIVGTRPSLQINKFSELFKNLANPIKSYIKASESKTLPQGVETITQVLNRFDQEVKPLLKNNNCLIIVGHGGFLDIVIKFHPWFKNCSHHPWLRYGQVKSAVIKSDRI